MRRGAAATARGRWRLWGRAARHPGGRGAPPGAPGRLPRARPAAARPPGSGPRTRREGAGAPARGAPVRLPGGIALYSSDYVSGVSASTLTPARRHALLDHSLRSQANAASLIRMLELGQLE